MKIKKSKSDDHQLIGWVQNGNSIAAPAGYNLYDFFGPNGEFLGPDADGVNPEFSSDGNDVSLL